MTWLEKKFVKRKLERKCCEFCRKSKSQEHEDPFNDMFTTETHFTGPLLSLYHSAYSEEALRKANLHNNKQGRVLA